MRVGDAADEDQQQVRLDAERQQADMVKLCINEMIPVVRLMGKGYGWVTVLLRNPNSGRGSSLPSPGGERSQAVLLEKGHKSCKLFIHLML